VALLHNSDRSRHCEPAKRLGEAIQILKSKTWIAASRKALLAMTILCKKRFMQQRLFELVGAPLVGALFWHTAKINIR